MPLAVASANPNNVEFMGRVGGRVLLGGAPHLVEGAYEALRKGALEAGREASRDQIWLSYVLHLAETTAAAVERFKDGATSEFYEFQIGVNGRPAPEVSRDDWYEGYVDQHLIGSPGDVTAKIETIVERSGGVGGFIFMSREFEVEVLPQGHTSWWMVGFIGLGIIMSFVLFRVWEGQTAVTNPAKNRLNVDKPSDSSVASE
jgi:alkanesulfonate monooxygenase SsuD/methylene tetrahydromethanopterin reductase-like flavin-dependent oxidoreductase (luciferase family)